MKKQFAEYYELPEERINEMWANSLIVFDTNVLLNLYRYPEAARNEFIKVIKFYKERLWIPYQVGLEFHRRREDIMRKNAAAYKSLSEKLSEQLVKVVNSLEGEYARHPYIKIQDIRKKVEKCATTIGKSLEKQSLSHPDYAQCDDILDAVTEVFDGCVGSDFSAEELELLYKEGEKRYENKVPPGYCDEKTKKDKPKRNLFGDLIVWKQTISHCKEQKQDVIFVTDDHKTDWWDKVEGKHSPRKELIREFSDSAGQSILIYDSSRFLEYAKQNKELKVSQKTINEVEKVKVADAYSASEELAQALFTVKSIPQVHKDIFDKYSKILEDAQPSYYNPTYLYSMGRYDSLEDWSRLIQEQMQKINASLNPFAGSQMKEALPANILEQSTEQ